MPLAKADQALGGAQDPEDRGKKPKTEHGTLDHFGLDTVYLYATHLFGELHKTI